MLKRNHIEGRNGEKMNKIALLQGFLRSPFEVGSIIPSSRFMVKQVVDYVKQESPNVIVELGAGTGVCTRELYKHFNKATSLIVFEKDDKMRNDLQSEFPDLSIHSDALDLPRILKEMDIQKVDCIVSGLPFSLFSKQKTNELFEKIHSQLLDNGCFIMYQYSTHMKKRLTDLFGQVNTKLVVLNIPPTYVYYCKKTKRGDYN
jgi:phospholipid N-methyltransferase